MKQKSNNTHYDKNPNNKKNRKDNTILNHDIHFKLSDKDYELLLSNLSKRGINQSDYFRELLRGSNQNGFYSKPVKSALDIITKSCVELRDYKTDETKVTIDNLEKGVKLLWQCSR